MCALDSSSWNRFLIDDRAGHVSSNTGIHVYGHSEGKIRFGTRKSHARPFDRSEGIHLIIKFWKLLDEFQTFVSNDDNIDTIYENQFFFLF